MSQFTDQDAMHNLTYIINNHPKVLKVIGDAMLASWARDHDRNVPLHQLTELLVSMIVSGLERIKFQGPAGPRGEQGLPGQPPAQADMIEWIRDIVRQNHKVLQGPRGDVGPPGPRGSGPTRDELYNACHALMQGMLEELHGPKGDTGPQGPPPTEDQIYRATRKIITEFVEKRDERIRGAQGAAGKPGRDGRDGKPGSQGPKGKDGMGIQNGRWIDLIILMLMCAIAWKSELLNWIWPKSERPHIQEVVQTQPTREAVAPQPQTRPVEPVSPQTLTLVKLGVSEKLPLAESIPSQVYVIEGYYRGEKIFSFRRLGSGWKGEYFRLIEEAVVEIRYRDPKAAASLPKTLRLTVEK